ncbi:phosphodiesterase [Paratractidigestivibacter sp.]|uniref:phosphodiesterase n=1 Tax=Paratractidigestivibacter sp. TaxID=2847316 RepID=UPI002ABE8033|nr:phosphodiesterase [Paratractidigestivibacter sp.]
MKLVIASDIHGAADWCAKLMGAVEDEQPDRVVLLGDMLYHGPRNDLPADYAPKRVIEMLNGIADRIIAVRGNCEAEVDQMVLDFPCMADHDILLDGGRSFFLTHGHIYGPGLHNSVDKWPTLPAGSALVYGHTHKKVLQQVDGHSDITVFNPGSVGIPKDGTHSFGIYEDGRFEHRILE